MKFRLIKDRVAYQKDGVEHIIPKGSIIKTGDTWEEGESLQCMWFDNKNKSHMRRTISYFELQKLLDNPDLFEKIN